MALNESLGMQGFVVSNTIKTIWFSRLYQCNGSSTTAFWSPFERWLRVRGVLDRREKGRFLCPIFLQSVRSLSSSPSSVQAELSLVASVVHLGILIRGSFYFLLGLAIACWWISNSWIFIRLLHSWSSDPSSIDRWLVDLIICSGRWVLKASVLLWFGLVELQSGDNCSS